MSENIEPAAQAEAREPRGDRVPTVDRIWGFLSSMRLALVLIFGIAAFSLIGVLVVQAPAGMSPSSEGYATWLQRVRPKYGTWTDVLSSLQLFTVASSIWTRILLAMLAVSTFVCTLNRWPRIWSSVFTPTIRADDAMLAGFSARHEATLSATSEPARALVASLTRRGYHVRAESDAAVTYVYADRFRHARLGTLVAHLALVGILAGTVASSLWGFRDDEFVVPEGSTRAVGFGTALAVRAESFVDEYYEAGGPKDYRSDIVLLDRGVEVARHTVRVNDPLVYGGVRFHQSFFGPAIVLQVADDSGKVLMLDGVALSYTISGRSVGYLEMPGSPVVAQIIGASGDPADGPPKPGQVQIHVFRDGGRSIVGSELLTLGQPKTIGGLAYTFVRERQFTGLKVVNDPGSTILWIASTLFVLGMAATFYFPFPRIWARLTAGPNGEVTAVVAGAQRRGEQFRPEVDRIFSESYLRAGPAGPRSGGGRAQGEGERAAPTHAPVKRKRSRRRD